MPILWSNIQRRSVDPYSSYHSDNVNSLNRVISPEGRGITHGLYLSGIGTNILNISKGAFLKDSVFIEFLNDIDLPLIDTHYNNNDFNVVAVEYIYEKVYPANIARIDIIPFSEFNRIKHLILGFVNIVNHVITDIVYTHNGLPNESREDLIFDRYVRLDATTYPFLDNSFDIGDSTRRYANIFSVNFNGTATSALYADLAEKYTVYGDNIKPGDIVSITNRNDYDCEICNEIGNNKIIGIVSENPAFKMNSSLENGYYIGIKGRLKCNCYGKVKKGDLLISYFNGSAISLNNPIIKKFNIDKFSVFCKAIENKDYDDYGLIEVFI